LYYSPNTEKFLSEIVKNTEKFTKNSQISSCIQNIVSVRIAQAGRVVNAVTGTVLMTKVGSHFGHENRPRDRAFSTVAVNTKNPAIQDGRV